MITLQQSTQTPALIASTVMQLGSPAQAEKTLAWAYTDSTSPCPNVCNVAIEPFDVQEIPGAKGIRRSRTEETDGAGPEGLFESFEIQFTDGPFLYDLLTIDAKPREASKYALIAAAKALYGRVANSPPLPEGSV